MLQFATADEGHIHLDIERLISPRSSSVLASGVRRVFELAATLDDPINLSIGQPDFDVPEPLKAAAIEAIRTSRNGYSVTQGIPELRATIAHMLATDLGWQVQEGTNRAHSHGPASLVTTGTSGALTLAAMALLGPGDEAILPDPYFVAYPQMIVIAGGTPVLCDTYPDGRMTAERVEPLITERTKFVLLNTPSNPTGVVLSQRECEELLELCRSKGVLLISDEIYDEFVFPESRTARNTAGNPALPSPCRVSGAHEDVLLIRGFGKTYGLTGWRMGYAAGPSRLISEMAKLQQFTFVCAPTPFQYGCVPVRDVDMEPIIADYATRRDLVIERLSTVTEVPTPGGAFYAFPRIPEKLGITASQFCEKAIERNLLVIPGRAFSTRDTHLRLSFASPRHQILRGLDVLCDMMG